MKRREFLRSAATAGVALGPVAAGIGPLSASAGQQPYAARPIVNPDPLIPPKSGKINVAFAIADGATIIDFCGPWEVFQDVHVHSRGETMDEMMPFRLYTVAATADPITASGGMKIMPNYTVANAPEPDVVVVPALSGNKVLHLWLAKVAPQTDVTMSVCTGAFQLARAGLLDGLVATTHHDFYDHFEDEFPEIELQRGSRFVENERISTAGGLTSGIDLALHVVERYFGRDVAQWTADYMEYQSDSWKV
ncbi:MAG: DJ-1/PfpI family protein [Gammaproteobacteria bacterium]